MFWIIFPWGSISVILYISIFFNCVHLYMSILSAYVHNSSISNNSNEFCNWIIFISFYYIGIVYIYIYIYIFINASNIHNEFNIFLKDVCYLKNKSKRKIGKISKRSFTCHLNAPQNVIHILYTLTTYIKTIYIKLSLQFLKIVTLHIIH